MTNDEHVYGRRLSTWLKAQRCLLILRRVQQGPASRETLIRAVERGLGSDAYGDAPEKALGRDIAQLRETWDLVIEFRQDAYHLLEMGTMPLLDLSDEALRGVAFLYDTFGPKAPGADDVRTLLQAVVSYLPEERREAVRRMRALPDLHLRSLDAREIEEATWSTVERAVIRRQQLAFDYLAPRHEEEEPRHHVVEPYDLDFRDGHYYLDAYCLEWSGPLGERVNAGTFNYRVDNIVPGTAEVLPTKLPPGRRRPRTYTLRYELAAEIARGGVSERFPETEVEMRKDGSALVTAEISDPFRAAQTLMRYRDKCRVLEPPEVVRIIKEAVRGMAEMYELVD